jgi:hypothetical protein
MDKSFAFYSFISLTYLRSLSNEYSTKTKGSINSKKDTPYSAKKPNKQGNI